MRFRQQYTDSEDDDFLGRKTAIDCSAEPSKTLQQYKDEVDINVMVRRFGVTGQPLGAGRPEPQFGDFTTVGDFQTELNRVREAEERFMRLPSEIRRRFDHDPAQLVAFVANDANYDEAVKLGLVPAPPAPSSQTVKTEELPS